MKVLFATAAAIAALASAPAVAGTYPFGLNYKADCVVWAVVPFPCHEGFDYQEPGNDRDAVIVEPAEEDEEAKGKSNAGGGNGSEGNPDQDPGNSGNTPAADND